MTERHDRRRVVVIGGGVAGLAAAWELSARDVAVCVLDAADRFGGKVRRETVGGTPVDVGPDAFVARRPEALALCAELGLADRLTGPGTAGAAVWARHRLRPLPAGLALGVPTRPLPLARSGIVDPVGALRVAVDLLARRPAAGPGDDWSVAELITPRLGRQVTERLVDPLVGGIHAGSVANLSAAAVFPDLAAAARHPGSLMRALAPPRPGGPTGARPASPFASPLDGGMTGLVDALVTALGDRGVELRPATAATGVRRPASADDRWRVVTTAGAERADAVVLATPADIAGSLLLADTTAAGPVRRLGRLLGAVDWADVVVATLAFAPGGTAERFRSASGTGFLVPVVHGLLTTGVTWLSAKWPAHYGAGPVLVRMSAGRDGDRRAWELDDDTLVRRLLGELRALTGDVEDPVDTCVTRWERAFPQYRVGHRRWVATVEAAVAAVPNLALAGAAFDGVGVPACIGTGRRAGGTIARALGVDGVGDGRPDGVATGVGVVGAAEAGTGAPHTGEWTAPTTGRPDGRAAPAEGQRR